MQSPGYARALVALKATLGTVFPPDASRSAFPDVYTYGDRPRAEWRSSREAGGGDETGHPALGRSGRLGRP